MSILVGVVIQGTCLCLCLPPPRLSLSLSLSTAAPHLPFFCHVPTRGIYVALSSRELSKGNLLADNGNTRQRVRFDAFVSKRTEPKVYNAGSLDADTNLVLNGHVPSSISLQCSFFSPLSSSLSLSLSIILLPSSNREFAKYTNTGFSRDLLLENVN